MTEDDGPAGRAPRHLLTAGQAAKRIAELQAQLAATKDCYQACQGFYEASQAEVERLRAERDFWRKGIEMHPWTKPGDMERHQAAFEAIMGGGRESGEPGDGLAGPANKSPGRADPVQSATPAAAKPAAHDLVDFWPRKRGRPNKEREG